MKSGANLPPGWDSGKRRREADRCLQGRTGEHLRLLLRNLIFLQIDTPTFLRKKTPAVLEPSFTSPFSKRTASPFKPYAILFQYYTSSEKMIN